MHNTSPHPTTALVLGGGGSTGNAWLIGVVAGLADVGTDVTDADVVVGTSAGATAAAQLTGGPTTAELLAAALAPIPPRPPAPPSGSASAADRTPGRPVADQLERMQRMIADSSDQADYRRRLGAAAIELAAGDASWTPRWRAIVAPRLAGPDWPDRDVRITAIDAGTGEPVVFDRHSGVELIDAVAASTSSGRPYRIGDTWYLDGGFRANAENADLAAGAERVLVLSPFGGRSLVPESWGTHLATQLAELHARGSDVVTIFPKRDDAHLFGPNGMDQTLRPVAAKAGFEQGRRLGDPWRR